MTIEVTQEDIDSGHRGHACECPIALAIMRHTKVPWHEVAVSHHYIWLDGKILSIGSIEEFVRRFDMKLFVEPFSFELDL